MVLINIFLKPDDLGHFSDVYLPSYIVLVKGLIKYFAHSFIWLFLIIKLQMSVCVCVVCVQVFAGMYYTINMDILFYKYVA